MTSNTKKFSLIGLCICIAVTVALAIVGLPGCDVLKENSAEIHQTVSEKLEEKVNNGGADKVDEELNKLVEDGKLSQWQAEQLKELLKNGYEKLQEKLKDLSKEQPEETAAE